MPRLRNETQVLIEDLKSRLDRIVSVAVKAGHDQALSEIRALVAGGGIPGVKRGPGRPRKNPVVGAAPKPKKRRKNPWASMTPEQKADRVRKMLAGRGLKPKNAE